MQVLFLYIISIVFAFMFLIFLNFKIKLLKNSQKSDNKKYKALTKKWQKHILVKMAQKAPSAGTSERPNGTQKMDFCFQWLGNTRRWKWAASFFWAVLVVAMGHGRAADIFSFLNVRPAERHTGRDHTQSVVLSYT